MYENRTELDENDLTEGGHRDALHHILAGNTLNTAMDSSYNRATGSYGSYDQSLESSQSSGSYGGSVSTQTSESRGSSSVHGSLETHGGSGTISGSTSSSEGSSTGRIGATTRVLGGSGSLLTGSGSLRSGSTGFGEGSYDSSSAYNSESYSSSSHRQDSTGGTLKSGCLSCLLIPGSGYSTHDASLGHSIGREAGGSYSHKQEMSREEHYEDGQLLRGREESRRYRDGHLVQEDRREYSDVPGQVKQPDIVLWYVRVLNLL